MRDIIELCLVREAIFNIYYNANVMMVKRFSKNKIGETIFGCLFGIIMLFAGMTAILSTPVSAIGEDDATVQEEQVESDEQPEETEEGEEESEEPAMKDQMKPKQKDESKAQRINKNQQMEKTNKAARKGQQKVKNNAQVGKTTLNPRQDKDAATGPRIKDESKTGKTTKTENEK